MERVTRPHPDNERLLLWADGELPPEAQPAMKKHLEACWQCRHELAQIEQAIGGAMEYRRQVRSHLPEPPAPWRDLTAGFDAIDRAMAPASVWQRLTAAVGFDGPEGFRKLAYVLPLGALAVAAAVIVVKQNPLASRTQPAETPAAAIVATRVPEPVPQIERVPTPSPASAPESRPEVIPAKEASVADLVSSQVRVVALLHERGADLGEPIEVTRTGGRVVVRGFGLDDTRAKELDPMLRAIPYVEPKLHESGAPAETAASPHIRFQAGISPFQSDMERALGSAAAADEWITAGLDNSENLMLHAHALRRLEDGFRTDVVATADAATLESIRQGHARAMLGECARLRVQLEVLRKALGAPLPKAIDTSGDYFTASRNLENALAGLAGAKPTEARLDSAVTGAMTQLAAVESSAQGLLIRR